MSKRSISFAAVLMAAALAAAAALVAPPAAAQAAKKAPAASPKALVQEINQKLMSQNVRGVYAEVGKDNVVVLSGAASRQEHRRAVRIVRSVPGVAAIKDQVFVQ